MTEATRKYAMTRLRKGDYLLPSNDLKWLWRIYTYEEYGSLVDVRADGTEHGVVGMFWACARRPMPPKDAPMDDILDWGDDGWEHWAGPLNSRKAAIEEALRVA